MDIREQVPLAPLTSWRIGGPARFLVEARTPDELRAARAWAREHGLPVLVMGGGTNMLVRDAGFAGLVLRYRDTGMDLQIHGDDALVRVGAGAPWAGSARRLAHAGWAGLEWGEGLPGTIGGAVYGNAGCYGGDVASCLQRAFVLVDDDEQEWPVAQFAYAYRSSALKSGQVRGIVLAAEFRLRRDDPEALAERMAATAAQRRLRTPWGRSCGSVFKNPPGSSAGMLIEQAGLKGHRIGGAVIARQHANYIVNEGGATSDDVLRLIELARSEVAHQFHITLELEVVVV